MRRAGRNVSHSSWAAEPRGLARHMRCPQPGPGVAGVSRAQAGKGPESPSPTHSPGSPRQNIPKWSPEPLPAHLHVHPQRPFPLAQALYQASPEWKKQAEKHPGEHRASFWLDILFLVHTWQSLGLPPGAAVRGLS